MKIAERIRALHPGSLFFKIAFAVVSGVLAVSIFILAAMFNISKQGYVETMSRSNEQIISMVQQKMNETNDKITNVELLIDNSWSFTQYFKTLQQNPQAFLLTYDMIKQLGSVTPDSFYDVAVVGTNGQSYVSNGSILSVSADELLKDQITQDAQQHPKQIIYRFASNGITENSKNSSAFIALKALTSPDSESVYGFAYVVIRQQDLQAFFDNLSNSTNNLMLLDESGTIVSSPNSDIVGQKNEELEKIILDMDAKKETSRYTTLQNKPVLILTSSMPRWGLHIVSAFDYTQALNEMNSGAYVLAICLLVTTLVLIAVFIFIRQITKPINKLVHSMESVTTEGIPDHFEVIGGGYEVRQLAHAFGVMIRNLNHYVSQLIKVEQEKREMEIHTLQMQINPHFIYNTLTSVKWLIWQNDSQKAVQSIDTFTLLLRNTISDSQDLIPIHEEVENLKSYVFLQKIRYGHKIQTDICVTPLAADCLIPKLLLQPFLENSFFHAFTNRQQGVISVFIDCHGQNLSCEIIDDGVGMSQSKADLLLNSKPDEHGHFIGIRNVNTRIHLLFGENYGVKIFSEPGNGTTVKVTLPMIQKNPLHKNNTNT